MSDPYNSADGATPLGQIVSNLRAAARAEGLALDHCLIGPTIL